MNHVATIRRSYPRDTAECGHGTCGAVVDCTGECALKAAMPNLQVIDEKFFDEQKLHAKLREMGNPMPIQYAEPEPERDSFWIKWFAGAVFGALLIGATLKAGGVL